MHGALYSFVSLAVENMYVDLLVVGTFIGRTHFVGELGGDTPLSAANRTLAVVE